MKYFVITDTHFNHKPKMFEVGRPENYEEQIAKSLSKVSENATLIHLGDVCIGDDEEMHAKYIEPLKCRKVLVRGNHDNKSDSWYYDHGWDFVCDLFTLKKYGNTLVFSHVPLEKPEGCINIHGHLHNMEHRDADLTESHRFISLEKQGYVVQSLEKII